ncbi:MAG: hypothetical protein PHD54_15360 [Desulfuromonadaceae bacterium]|nr:hypothetical protein [Desulfuromonadaceae bacterium]
MKTFLMAVSIVAFMTASAFAMNVGGSYNTSEGDLTLNQNGDRIFGRYTKDNGEITGLLYDSTLDGFWIEDISDRRCSSSKNGRYYWGRISLEFSGNGFSGSWGYCNDSPSRQWTGSRVGGKASGFDTDKFARDDVADSIEGVWSSSEGDISLSQNGSRVRGNYNPQDNGEITGTIKGSTLSSYWIENHSSQRCSSPKNGRYYWGTLKLTFNGDRFSGQWGYCDEQPSRSWTGQRK